VKVVPQEEELQEAVVVLQEVVVVLWEVEATPLSNRHKPRHNNQPSMAP
jgi:hypothetical protein